VAVAAIPIATVLTVDAVFDVDVGVLRWVTLGWAVVYVLIAIDPALKEKIKTARATAGLPSPPPDRKEQSSVRSET
jgi:hypothetical protein